MAAHERWFGRVLDRRCRYDMHLSISDPPVRVALQQLAAKLTTLLAEVVTVEARVVELSSLIADPGAARQPWHPDSLLPSLVGAPLFTCFVALQPIVNCAAARGPRPFHSVASSLMITRARALLRVAGCIDGPDAADPSHAQQREPRQAARRGRKGEARTRERR